jgi:uncharacterized protein YutE (UPF0331/DUF86 family)
MINQEMVLKRIDQLLQLINSGQNQPPQEIGPQVYTGALQLASLLYGTQSHQIDALKEIHKRSTSQPNRLDLQHRNMMYEITGTLRNYRSEVEEGIVASIQKQAQGEVLSDFISLSKQALQEGSKDVAAVLACAALEDCLKKFARSQGLDADDKDMSEVINILKSKELLKQPESKIAQSYVTFRNKAFHADWNKIGEPEVGSAIGFVENFLLTHFSA